MTVTYKLSTEDIEKIISQYMKDNYNMKLPNVRVLKEKQENYYGDSSEVIVAYISEF